MRELREVIGKTIEASLPKKEVCCEVNLSEEKQDFTCTFSITVYTGGPLLKAYFHLRIYKGDGRFCSLSYTKSSSGHLTHKNIQYIEKFMASFNRRIQKEVNKFYRG